MTTLRDVATSAVDLIGRHRPGSSSFFASPTRTLLAEGTCAVVPPAAADNQLADLPDRVAATLRAAGSLTEAPIVVGAVPFDHGQPAHLVVPERVHRAGALADESAESLAALDEPFPEPDTVDSPSFDVRPVPEPEAHLSAVARAVARMRSGEFEKVVLARSLELTVSNGDGPVDVRPLLRRLARRDPGGYTFGIDLPGERTLVGASPELLVSRSGTRVVSNPLAGSRPRSVDPVEDRRRAEELLVSAKDLHEHAVVAEFVVETLRPFCRVLEVPSGPSLVRTASMWHLSTRVSGELVDPGVSALGLACALHPTPAVCGTPTGLARAAIGELEPFDRGFYTGLLGWGDASGDGEWVVTIRCAEAVGNLLRLFAGGGIVADSVPGEELAETSAKFGTMLRALGVDQPL